MVVGARFIDGLRQANGIVAGAAHLGWWRFRRSTPSGAPRGSPYGCWSVTTIGAIYADFQRHEKYVWAASAALAVALLIRDCSNGDPGMARKRKKHKTSRAPRNGAPLTLKSPSGFASAMPTSRPSPPSSPSPSPRSIPDFETLLYSAAGPVATITLNRPEHLNTIVPPMPDEIEAAVGLAERDRDIKVIVLRGAGRAFSGGYDFGGGFQHWGEAMMTGGKWDPGKDFAMVSARETGPTHKFMAIWRASKPVIAQVHGWCVGGASDYALCADIVIASEDAVIGTPYSRMWGLI
ncbi:hypothetical protein NIIDMKKI_66980 [Mycobacterium kansasii]|uniref:Enoyl-CoA hydratase/isomerase family protein n=1 Tax=Mycobacterium kansasii TaxID=1768 RepID=A0A7G1IN30_MYCKA|nr:hypothetical protein NIIDMKKI_66980 [Mycobacterium kansasii]